MTADDPARPVLFFTSRLGGGGAEKHMVRVANRLPRDTFEPVVAARNGRGEYLDILDDGISVHDLEAPSMYRAVLPLTRLLRDLCPAIVCSFMDRANCAASLATSLAGGDPRLVLSVQDSPSVRLADPESVNERVLLRGVKWFYPKADAVVAISSGVREDLLGLIPEVQARSVVIPNAGVDPTNRVDRLGESIERPDDRIVLVACGRLTRHKGFDILLESMPRVLKNLDAELWILGEGPREGELKQQASSLEIEEAVHFLGWKSNPLPYMNAADIFVLSSRWEAFGNVVVEAMAVGTPVVATRTHGPQDIIRPPDEGILVEPGNPRELAEGILHLGEDADLRDSISKASKKRSQAFKPEAVAEAYRKVFRRVLSDEHIQSFDTHSEMLT